MTFAPLIELKNRLLELSHLATALGILEWDQEVIMPKRAVDARAKTISYLSAIVHNKFIEIDSDGLLTSLKKQLQAKKLNAKDAVIVAETCRSYEREVKLPESFVKEMAETASKSQSVWAKARNTNDFKLFLPWLNKIVKLKRQEAEYIGYKKSPYDALLDVCEPGMTSETASIILNDLKDSLVPFLKKIKASHTKADSKKIKGKFLLEDQIAFNKYIAGHIGFDFEAGRLDTGIHPATFGTHPHDIRITTRYRDDDIYYSLSSTLHETGHGLYEQGIPVEHFGTPLGESISLGIHESQSRLWENFIGKSPEFWKYFYPELQKKFPVPFKKLSIGEFYQIINDVQPSLIRVDADEVTYNLHIIIRFEIEKDMIEGKIDLASLPSIWNAKVKKYLGISVPSDAEGVLQDVHWSCGLIGYFPTYSFGNLYAAQFYAKMQKDIPDFTGKISRGKYRDINKWLRTNIHGVGKTYKASELVKKVTGEKLESKYFMRYLKMKFLTTERLCKDTG
jgi:carboxypeptidase Taq